ncbi:MAG: hypothetical protein EAZ62_00340 [Sphingobacteriia bacterium]|nr:MAG: hypothetical protein EAZ62_00340 [Sphingobacteriia bacterium]
MLLVSFFSFIEGLVLGYLGMYFFLPLLFLFLHLVSSFFSRRQPPQTDTVHSDYACIVTAYEETGQIPMVVESLLKMDSTSFHVYVVADKCDVSGLHFPDSRVTILRPPQTLSSNTKSHFYAIDHFIRPHNRLAIIDSDNLVDAGFLLAVESYFTQGFEAVQGVRKAKNLNTVIAGLDGARDLFYHFYDGKLLFGLGSSATLSGSGMAFSVDLYEDCLRNLPIEGAGFDKVLQYEVVRRNKRIAFAENAVVYDEKTAQADQLVKQRARWINTWFRYFGFGFNLLAKGLLALQRNQILFGIILLRPPLFIFLGLGAILTCLGFWVGDGLAVWGLVAMAAFVFAFFISLVLQQAEKRIWKSLVGVPLFVFYQVLSLLKVRKANRHSVATKHFYDSPPPPQP